MQTPFLTTFLRNNGLVLGLLALNVVLKCLYLTAQPVSHDEPFSIYHAQFSFAELIHYLKSYPNPPLYELLLHCWIKVAGISETAVRILPMLFSSLSVIFIYRIGEKYFNRGVALVAGLLYSFSTMQVWYAHDCRSYPLFLFLTLVSFYYFFRSLQQEKLPKPALLLLVLINTALIYTHYFGFIVLFLQALMVCMHARHNRKALFHFCGVMALCALLYIPQMLTLYTRFYDSATRGTWLKVPAGMESLYNMIWSFSNAPVVAVLCLGVFVAALLRYVLVSKGRIHQVYTGYIVLWFVVPFFCMFAVSYKIPMFLDRYLIFITPAFYLLLAASLNALFAKPRVFMIAAGVLVLCFLVTLNLNPGKKRPVKEVVAEIVARKDQRTLVLVCSPEFMTTFAYYYNRDYFSSLEKGSEYNRLIRLLQNDQVYFIDRLEPGLVAYSKGFEKIIYLDAAADFTIPGNTIKKNLLETYQLTGEKFYPEIFHMYFFKQR